MTTKYNIKISDSTININVSYLTNQLWKLIPMRENNENWQTQLQSVIIELSGLSSILNKQDAFLSLLSKLEGLLVQETEFLLYRKIIFECISQLRGLLSNE